MRRIVMALIFVVAVILMATFIIVPMIQPVTETTPISELPSSDRLAYKVVGMTNGGYMAYRVYTIEGWAYNVTESDWQIVDVPTRIGPNLYRLPNGNYVTGVVK